MSAPLPRDVWVTRAQAHAERVDVLTAAHRERRGEGRSHPVEDFLFEYYHHSPAHLRRWHPGPGVALADAAGEERARWTHYASADDGSVSLDVAAFMAKRGRTVTFVRDLLAATLSRPAHLGCFGLHEWAMVYGQDEDEVRHVGWPLRLGAKGTDEVVERHRIRCSHYDAFRFYTPPARSLNLLQPTRESQVDLEQPGCLHAGMDVYKWAFKLAPAVPSELTADAFALAKEIRELDMRAAPYDLRELGYEPIRIETAEGKAEYVERQRGHTEASNALRHRLIEVCDRLLAASPEASNAPQASPLRPRLS
ncbi:3-methyladenine DNA glycosylase [Janibacter sp. G56]|uniref:3-methyladenine DNA glycosylase n=1 Tax=Janibacter sp. G56 TaxID=3418717 RepID=UPI003CFC8067